MMKQLIIISTIINFIALNWTQESFAQGSPMGGSSQPLRSTKDGTPFSQANPEDITNENFPNLIESFDYPNADISEVVKAISKLTGKNFILDKGVSGKISIIAPSQITVAEAYKAFLTALAMNNYTVVPSGNFLKIRNVQQASKESIDTYAGTYFPNSDQLITRIVKLKYVNAEEMQKTLRPMSNPAGDMAAYGPTNSLIITDYGSNIERLMTIINQIDVPGFEEKLVVIPIKHARAKDMADLIDQIINKGEKKGNQFNAGIPRFRAGGASSSGSGSGAANYSLVIPDTRTNSIIVVGNDAGILRIRELVGKLDFRIRPEEGGGVWVYYVRHGEAEKIANVLNGIATESEKSKTQAASGAAGSGPVPGLSAAPAASEAIFGGNVKVAADKDNNSLIVTAGKQDYDIVKSILSKIDIPRDQVFVKAVIMEMSSNKTNNWSFSIYKFQEDSDGFGRAGFAGESVANIADVTKDSGMVLGFGSSNIVNIKVGGATIPVPDLVGFLRFVKSQTDANILSAPQITALDNEKSTIEVGENVPVSANSNITSAGGAAANIERQDLTLKLELTPYISPDTDSVRMKINQQIRSLSNTTVRANELSQKAVAFSKRTIDTNIIVNSNDTAVIGGLMADDENEVVTKVPVLGDIPIIGWLFKSKGMEKNKKNLLLFITPKIIRTAQDSSEIMNAKLNERIDFIQQNLNGRDPYGAEVDKLPRRAMSEEEVKEYIPDTTTQNANTVEDDTMGAETGEVPAESGSSTLPGEFEEGE